MKKTIVLLAMLVVSFCRLQAQSEDRISNSLAAKFAADFPDATDPRWARDEGFDLAYFFSDGNLYVAYYDKTENRVALARKVASRTQLPLHVQQALDESCEKLGDSTRLGPIFELITAGSTHYVVSVEGREKTCTFSFDPSGNRAIMEKRPTQRYGPGAPEPYIAREPR
ncbi:MAG TPA: hypothetical protein VIL31_17655 [Cyclobacteriaceae bacterium]|jgi:hypothetical protein